MGLLWLGADWPMHDLAEGYLYCAHMVQHMLFTLVAAPLLVAGIPAWMWRAMLRPAPVGRVFGFAYAPARRADRLQRVLLFTHWPEVGRASVGSELAHFSLHVLIVASAVVMWWPVLSPLPELPVAAPARADALPVPAVARADDPGVVPHVRADAPVPRLRDIPADLGDRRAHRPAGRGSHHEARRRVDPVGRHRGDLLPLVTREKRDGWDALAAPQRRARHAGGAESK